MVICDTADIVALREERIYIYIHTHTHTYVYVYIWQLIPYWRKSNCTYIIYKNQF